MLRDISKPRRRCSDGLEIFCLKYFSIGHRKGTGIFLSIKNVEGDQYQPGLLDEFSVSLCADAAHVFCDEQLICSGTMIECCEEQHYHRMQVLAWFVRGVWIFVNRVNEHVDVIIKMLYCFFVEHNWFCLLSLTGKIMYNLKFLRQHGFA